MKSLSRDTDYYRYVLVMIAVPRSNYLVCKMDKGQGILRLSLCFVSAVKKH